MRNPCSTNGEDPCRILVQKPEKKRPLGRPICRLMANNIKHEGVVWIGLILC
jgi:hypothetical protein